MEESHEDKLSKHVKSRRTSFDDIPPELLPNIFAWLPFSSILRLSRTCKLWHKLMCDPRVFVNKHSRHGHLVLTTTQLYYVEKVGNYLWCLGPKPRSHRHGEMISYPHSSGGVVVSRAYTDSQDDDVYHYFVVENPITGERFEIPDEQFAYTSCGFGYSPSTHEYKLVRLGDIPCQVSVFTIGSGRWRRLDDSPFSPDGTLPVECEGCIFWKVHQFFNKDWLVMSFDVASECIRGWKGPNVGEDIKIRSNIRVVKMGGYVACVCGTWTNELQIWVLKDMGKDVWVKEHNIFSSISPPLVFDNRICSGTWMHNDVFFGRDDERPTSYYRYLNVVDGRRGTYEVVKCPLRKLCLGAVPHIGSLWSPFTLLGEQQNH